MSREWVCVPNTVGRGASSAAAPKRRSCCVKTPSYDRSPQRRFVEKLWNRRYLPAKEKWKMRTLTLTSDQINMLICLDFKKFQVFFLKVCCFFFNKCIYLFLAALGLHCCARAFSSCGEQGLLFVVIRGLLIGWLLLLWSTGSRHAGFSSCGTQAQ